MQVRLAYLIRKLKYWKLVVIQKGDTIFSMEIISSGNRPDRINVTFLISPDWSDERKRVKAEDCLSYTKRSLLSILVTHQGVTAVIKVTKDGNNFYIPLTDKTTVEDLLRPERRKDLQNEIEQKVQNLSKWSTDELQRFADHIRDFTISTKLFK